MAVAIVTGASSGLGKSFVEQAPYFFGKINEIWLIARRKEKLKEIAIAQKKKFPNIRYTIIPADLTKEEGLKKIETLLKEKKPGIAILINNAGFGKYGKFEDVPLSQHTEIVSLNVLALLRMTYIALPFMAEGSSIINVASAAAYIPLPYNSVYSATKAFVLNFSAALYAELRTKGIHVLALCPGPVKTEFFSRFYGKDITQFDGYFKDPNDVVKRALRDVLKGKLVSIPGKRVKLSVFLSSVLPNRWILKLMHVVGRKRKEHQAR